MLYYREEGGSFLPIVTVRVIAVSSATLDCFDVMRAVYYCCTSESIISFFILLLDF